MSSGVKVDTSELTKFAAEVKGIGSRFNYEASQVISNAAMKVRKGAMDNLTKNRSVKTGHLRGNIDTNIKPFEATIRANTKYAKGVEEGTKPHIIKPKRGKFLYWKGAAHPVKLVNHPGSRAKPYLVPAFEKETKNIIKDLEKLIKW